METQNWLLKQAATQPNHLAIDDGKQKLTFGELKERVELVAGKLNLLTPGNAVGLLAKNDIESYCLALAVISTGRSIVWLNWRLSDEELRRQIKDAKLQLCLVDRNLNRTMMATNNVFMEFKDFFALEAKRVNLVDTFDFDKVASIMYTSGTTGDPKGVLQTFANHFYSAISSALNLGLKNTDEWLCVAPIFHISGFSIVMRGLIYGMTVRLVDKFESEKIENILVQEPITIMSVVPYMLKKLLLQQQTSHKHYQNLFRCMLLGGGTIDLVTLQQCEQLKIPVVQCYGMTETCSQIVALSANDALRKLGSVGQPLFSTQLKLSSKNEVLIKTPALTPGYLNLPKKLPAKEVEGWYKTGDVGHLDQEGFLYIDGRLDDMLISGGENIFPQEVEEVYLQDSEINDIAVVGKDDPEWGQVPVAFVVGKPQNSEDLIAYGYAHLAHYKVPREFVYVEELPKNASGKIQRFKLQKRLD